MDIVFENLPDTRRPNRADPEEHQAAAQLRHNPHAWARVFVFDSSAKAGAVAQQINTNKRAAFKTGFEARSRTVDGEARVYVRYAPETTDS